MSCQRAFEIELEDLLLAPDSGELRSFEVHARECVDCSTELGRQRALIAKLRGGDPAGAVWHPSDDLLLAYRTGPDGIEAGDLSRLRSHLESCGPCHDAFEAYRGIAGTSQRVDATPVPLWPRRLTPLRGLFAGMPLPAALSAGLALGVGLILFFSACPLEPEADAGATRGGPTGAPTAEPAEQRPNPLEVVLVAGQRVSFDASSAPRAGGMSLLLLLTRDAPDTLLAELDTLDSERIEITARRDERGRRFGVLPLRDGMLAAGIHRVRLFVGGDATAPLLEYEVEVR